MLLIGLYVLHIRLLEYAICIFEGNFFGGICVKMSMLCNFFRFLFLDFWISLEKCFFFENIKFLKILRRRGFDFYSGWSAIIMLTLLTKSTSWKFVHRRINWRICQSIDVAVFLLNNFDFLVFSWRAFVNFSCLMSASGKLLKSQPPNVGYINLAIKFCHKFTYQGVGWFARLGENGWLKASLQAFTIQAWPQWAAANIFTTTASTWLLYANANICKCKYIQTRSIGALRAQTSRLRPFGPAW